VNERIKELAEQAGLLHLWVYGSEPTGSLMIKPVEQQIIEHFAELVRQDEREACAKLCEQTDIVQYISGIHTRDDASGTLDKAAKAIRARGNT
jgi:hypothetical protein